MGVPGIHMPSWIRCPLLDGKPIELNMSRANFATEEFGNLAAVCFGSGDRDRIPVQESKDRLAAMIGENKEARRAKRTPPGFRGVIY
jgi:hypothetical protein